MSDNANHLSDPVADGVYQILCDFEEPPEDHHWEGFVAQKIADKLIKPHLKTLRDEFAMAALQGAIAHCGLADFSWCYEVADKMLLVKKEKP